MNRRTVVAGGLAAPALAALPAAAQGGGKTFVLLHGAWHGGWCWRDVAEVLRAGGHRVFTPTQTGLGERKHLMSREITLDTFVADVVNVLEAEELEDVILVGHSFGGLGISGAADRVPQRIRHLVYLDSLILEGGQSPFGILPAEVVAQRRQLVQEQGQGIFIPPPPPSAFGIPDGHPNAAWVRRRLTPHPVGTYESPLNLRNPVGNGRPATYIIAAEPIYGPLEVTRRWVRNRPGWTVQEIRTGHDTMVTAPEETARMLSAIG
ncbi:alpha/beta fold hydrolase [Sabulicella rubraurantiaca]|uniref:alpha/beta fold hydrolase n=1 Tax=Sabulicella rubraurantiaca TaxID=2811429 RepID=UPI001A976D8B|nr:alpha/beta hydrolase [Sabulicella rubraurantiaca]